MPGVHRERVPTSLLYTDAEITAARRLRLTPDQVRSVARQLWEGRSLDAERERRLDEQAVPSASRAPYRSHVTRALMTEMTAALGLGDDQTAAEEREQ